MISTFHLVRLTSLIVLQGYYIDVGCSQLIIDGKVKIKQGQEIERFEENGIRFKDGSFLEADIVVLATGMTLSVR